jgi:sugar phosphate isomerase/epimerase
MLKNSRNMKKLIIAKTLVCISFLLWGITDIFAQVPSKIAVQLYSFRDLFAKDVEGTMAKVKGMGFKNIETAGTYGMKTPEFKKVLDKYGLKAVSYGSSYEELRDNIQTAIDNAKVLGAKYVVCFWIPHDGDSFTIEHTKKAVEDFNKWGKILKDNNLTFCYHPHGYEFRQYENKMLFDYLVENTNPKYVSFEMDIFWIHHPGQNPAEILKKYPTRFPLLHIKDCQKGTIGNQNGHADVETNVVAGTGELNMVEIIKVAKKIGIKYYIIEDESSRSEIQVPKSIDYLKNNLK